MRIIGLMKFFRSRARVIVVSNVAIARTTRNTNREHRVGVEDEIGPRLDPCESISSGRSHSM
jgi:hypothetical protein